MPNNILTRGLSIRHQSLVVWGYPAAIGVVCVGTGPGSPAVYEQYLEQAFAVWVTYTFDVVGNKEYELELDKEFEVIGTRLVDFQDNIEVMGIKEAKLLYEKYLSGTKQFDLNETISVEGSREFNISETKSLQGIREIKLKEDLNIVGQKDITNILEAVDII